MKKSLIIIFIVFVFFIGCKKIRYETTSARVTVINAGTGKPIPNAGVLLMVDRLNTSPFSKKTNNNEVGVIQEQTTGADGSVWFNKIDCRKNENYKYYFITNRYINGVKDENIWGSYIDPNKDAHEQWLNQFLVKGEINHKTIKVLIPFEKLTFRLNTQPPYIETDSLSFLFKSRFTDFPELGKNTFSLAEVNSNVIYSLNKYDSGLYDLKIRIVKNGIVTNITDTLLIDISETKEYVIPY